MFFDDDKDTVAAPAIIDAPENECDIMYGMGSSYELSEEECQYEFLACKIFECSDPGIKSEMEKISKTKKFDIDSYKKEIELLGGDVDNLVNSFIRTDGGYLNQLKRHLNIDLSLFDYSDIRNLRERIKIIYLLYKSKKDFKYITKMNEFKKDIPSVNILELISNQSMENIDFSALKWKTYNGEYVYLIKDNLKKEMDKDVVELIEELLYSIHRSLDQFLDAVLYRSDDYCSQGMDDYAKDYINHKIQETKAHRLIVDKIGDYTPIETFYFRVKQYEYIGQIKDILLINNIKYEPKHNISTDMIEEMKELAKCKIQIDEIEDFINNAPKIAKYVYLRDDISKSDINKIRRQKNKINQMINFLHRATPLKAVDYHLNQLHIISFLQAIIIDKKDEIFNYTFYGYQNHFKHKQHVQVSINPNRDNSVVDALKIYWTRKINDHWYANIGRYEVRCKMRELENACDESMLRLLLEINF